ncbi:MAG: heme lyase CcmF/NrfE family subunit [Myxococcales bacterium]|nr:heme lyase CcmF/NrfE family subunit [Myxococcales bacterium]
MPEFGFADFGYLAMLTAMVVACYTAAAAIVGYHRRDTRLAISAQNGVYVVFGCLSIASLALIYLFVTDDYSVKYVHHYSDRSMPLFYKATAFWGGQDGSLLFWVWVMSVWSAVAVYVNKDKNRAILPYTIVAMMAVTLFFTILMILNANPFETYLGGAPSDGRGLNPLLQNPYMVTHPPSLYLGYIGWTIPFCFAIGALAHGHLDYGWVDAMRRWCLAAWVFLTIGLVLGGLWAYEELGWGGYWAWDPVENAAFIPWLTGTAFIHSIQVQERRQSFKMWNVILIILTFVLTLVGTMMTRSGIVQSVHAFAQSDIGNTFLVFIAITVVVSTGLVIWRAKELAPENRLESVLSREFVFLLNNWILVMMAFFVLFGTLFPSVYRFFYGQEVNVGASFFNLWMRPLGLILLFLTGVGPLLPWRKSTSSSLFKQFVMPTTMAALAAPIMWGLGLQEPWALTTFCLCVLVTTTIIQEFWRGSRARMRNSQESFGEALLNLMGRAKRRYGGYIIHFGLVLTFVAFAGNAYKIEDEQQLQPGERARVGNYEVRFDRLESGDDGQKSSITAHVTVFKAGTDEVLGTLAPAKWSYRVPEEQVTTEVDKRLSLRDDLYLVLGGYDPRTESVALQLKVNPLVNFLWIGTAVMLIGWAVAVWPARSRQQVRAPQRFGWAWAGAGSTALLMLGVLSCILAVIG